MIRCVINECDAFRTISLVERLLGVDGSLVCWQERSEQEGEHMIYRTEQIKATREDRSAIIVGATRCSARLESF